MFAPAMPAITRSGRTIHRPHVKPAPFPRASSLMLCTLVNEAFDDEDWIFEPKLDGLRVECRFDGKRLTLLSRNDKVAKRSVSRRG